LIMITVFYLFILFVKNFWDIIFMNKIGEIYSANYEFTESEKDDLGLEYLCANTTLERNIIFRHRFLKYFITLNLMIFVV
jgi:hypothetical protein